jgi:hypothetical protein
MVLFWFIVIGFPMRDPKKTLKHLSPPSHPRRSVPEWEYKRTMQWIMNAMNARTETVTFLGMQVQRDEDAAPEAGVVQITSNPVGYNLHVVIPRFLDFVIHQPYIEKHHTILDALWYLFECRMPVANKPMLALLMESSGNFLTFSLEHKEYIPITRIAVVVEQLPELRLERCTLGFLHELLFPVKRNWLSESRFPRSAEDCRSPQDSNRAVCLEHKERVCDAEYRCALCQDRGASPLDVLVLSCSKMHPLHTSCVDAYVATLRLPDVVHGWGDVIEFRCPVCRAMVNVLHTRRYTIPCGQKRKRPNENV